MRDSTELPDLRMLPVAALKPHEDYDPRRIERLSQRLLADGILKNPPIVARIPDSEDYVILDGANRVMACDLLQIPHIVAQLVDYHEPGLRLETWYHVVAGMPVQKFEKAVSEINGVTLKSTTLEEARQAIEQGQAGAYLVRQDKVYLVTCDSETMAEDLNLLTALVNTYRGRADIFRASNDVWEKQAPFYPEITALVVFPSYHPNQVIAAARDGYKVPSGITRHIIPYRALNINIPLKVLAADWGLERKRAWLQEWLMERMAANAIRFYEESTFSFNE
jgi:hypothetical protein